MIEIEKYLDDHRERNESELFDLLRIASVSTDSQYSSEVAKAGHWVASQFEALGFETEVVRTQGHPIVYAETPAVAGAPVVLVYGHYDVQPPDPLDQWQTPPFEPTVRDGNVYARGATDDKGQMLTHIKSAQAWIETKGQLPIQIKYIIEGEEECGSSNLEPFLLDFRERLTCDIAVISDTSQFAQDQPAITYGLKGIVYFEVFLTGPGASAGGHLAALLGTSGGVMKLEGTGGWPDQSSRVQAVYDLFGPTDLTRFVTTPGYRKHALPDSPESRLIGGPVLENKAAATAANPIHYVSKDDPPFLIYHGSLDPTVPPNQSQLLHAALNRTGVPSTLHIIENARHGGREFATPEVQRITLAFLRKSLK